MAKINYQNLPSTSTPLNATNLNAMQNITEVGSNANGRYVKYEDGTLIQWNDMKVQDQAINAPYGSIYIGSREITFPISFYDLHYVVTCPLFRWGTGASWGGGYMNSTVSKAFIRGYDYFSRLEGEDVEISWVAIGRWKA